MLSFTGVGNRNMRGRILHNNHKIEQVLITLPLQNSTLWETRKKHTLFCPKGWHQRRWSLGKPSFSSIRSYAYITFWPVTSNYKRDRIIAFPTHVMTLMCQTNKMHYHSDALHLAKCECIMCATLCTHAAMLPTVLPFPFPPFPLALAATTSFSLPSLRLAPQVPNPLYFQTRPFLSSR